MRRGLILVSVQSQLKSVWFWNFGRFGNILEDLGPALNTWFPSDPILEQVNLVFNYVQIIIQWFNDEIPSAISGKCRLRVVCCSQFSARFVQAPPLPPLHTTHAHTSTCTSTPIRFGHASVEVRMAVSWFSLRWKIKLVYVVILWIDDVKCLIVCFASVFYPFLSLKCKVTNTDRHYTISWRYMYG